MNATSACTAASALFVAASNGHLDVVQCLVRARAAIDQANHSSETPLYAAASNGHAEVARYLVEAGADKHSATASQSTPLHIAAEYGFKEIVDLLLAAGADPHLACDGDTPLHTACEEGHGEIVASLLEAGADQGISGSDRSRSLLAAAQGGHTEVLRCFMRLGEVGTRKSLETLLMKAAVQGYQRWLPCLFEAGIDPDATAEMGYTALGVATQFGRTAVASSLLQARADKDKRMKDGSTPLLLAAQFGRLEIAELLLHEGADIDAALENGETAWTLATKRGHTDLADFLAKAGVRPVRPELTAASSVGYCEPARAKKVAWQGPCHEACQSVKPRNCRDLYVLRSYTTQWHRIIITLL